MITLALYWENKKLKSRGDVGMMEVGYEWALNLMWTLSVCKMTPPGRGFFPICHQQIPLCNLPGPGVTTGADTA